MEGIELIEKWCEIIYTAISIATPVILILPKFLFSLVVYFTGGATASDALLLPTPTWYVYSLYTEL